MSLDLDQRDPLHVLRSTLTVVEHASSVRIEPRAFPEAAAQLATLASALPDWRSFPHWWSDDPARTTLYVLVLDALNFCFWGEPRWTIDGPTGPINGYVALAAALTRAVERGDPLLDAQWLESVDAASLASLLGGQHTLPLMDERAAHLRELGRALRGDLRGNPLNLLEQAGYRAPEVARRISQLCSSFHDTASYDGAEVVLLKRAQILASDLAAALDGSAVGPITGLDELTAFADYKVPQVLRELGLISYAPTLAGNIDHQIEIPPGSREEVEIRAAAIWAVESLRQELVRQGRALTAAEIDWCLWTIGQTLHQPRPYHRTRTIYY